MSTSYRGSSLPSNSRFRWYQKYYSSRSPPSNQPQMKHCSVLELQYARPCPLGRMYSSPLDTEFYRDQDQRMQLRREDKRLWSLPFVANFFFQSPIEQSWTSNELLVVPATAVCSYCPLSRMSSCPNDAECCRDRDFKYVSSAKAIFRCPRRSLALARYCLLLASTGSRVLFMSPLKNLFSPTHHSRRSITPF